MAARIIAARRVVVYLPNLSAAVRHFQTFNFIDGARQPPSCLPPPPPSSLAGLIHSDKVLTKDPTVMLKLGPQQCSSSSRNIDYSVLEQFNDFQVKDKKATTTPVGELKPTAIDRLECLVVECNDSLKKDFGDLFVDRDTTKGPMSVITLSQKTVNDMSCWSPEVEEEREQLLETFIAGATDICQALRQAGYWADFVDPESGRPSQGSYTPATLFETDHRYKKLGFQIQDLGCCKVIMHKTWGAFVYVGSLFTDAPIDHPVLSKLKHRLD